jgi:hypothetical protein
MYLDESGDHSLTIVDPSYPVFVLGGIIVDQGYAEGEMTERIQQFKRDVFEREDIILHTADIVRNKNGFESLKDNAARERFYTRLNDLMRSLDYQVVACAIKKDEHLARYGAAALDPYLLSFDVLVERFCYAIGPRQGGGVMVAEQRNPTLDHELELAWLNLKISGTSQVQATEIEHRIAGLNLRDKRSNVSGLQLADLVVSPIGRYVIGKPVKEDFHVIESKFRRAGRGSYLGTGLVVLPKQ